MGNGIWRGCQRRPSRRCHGGVLNCKRPTTPGSLVRLNGAQHGKVYSEEELWENYAYFIRQVVPVAEQAGVGIASIG
jgi:mannonate dehydratase